MTADETEGVNELLDECSNEEFVRLLLFVIYGFWSIWWFGDAWFGWFGETAPSAILQIPLFEFGVVEFWF
jgi:hypothetical protein